MSRFKDNLRSLLINLTNAQVVVDIVTDSWATEIAKWLTAPLLVLIAALFFVAWGATIAISTTVFAVIAGVTFPIVHAIRAAWLAAKGGAR